MKRLSRHIVFFENRVFSIVARGVVLVLLFGLWSCRPSSVLSNDKMVDVITDLHKAEAIIQAAGMNYSHEEECRAYYAQVLEEHSVTQAEFDSSMMWYAAHPSFFQRVYPRVIARLEQEQTEEIARLDRLEEERRIADSIRNAHLEWLRLIHSRSYEQMVDRTQLGLPTDQLYRWPTYHTDLCTDSLYRIQSLARETFVRDSLEKRHRDSVMTVITDSIRTCRTDSLLLLHRSADTRLAELGTLAQRTRLLSKKERQWLDSLVIAETAPIDSMMRQQARLEYENTLKEQKKRDFEKKMIEKFARFKKM
ncbi:MAG: DUF4296 domain-containing protein [Paludibacteraceae bacterium]|nr:DUF4296 domain-containing protein [Paludibacteraceae bacterium]